MPRIGIVWPYGVAIAAVIAFLGFLAKQLASTVIERIGLQWYSALADRREGLSRHKLRTYRRKVARHDSQQPLGFHAVTIDVGTIYVPPQYEDGHGRRHDLFAAAQPQKRVVALGPAGAGKSMFLRYWLVRWARSPRDFTRIPVLVELNAVQRPEDTVVGLVLARLRDRGLKLTEQALETVMAQGKLCLLLDGLDEVPGPLRSDVLDQIRRLAERVEPVQIVLTCRETAWDARNLQPQFISTVRLAGFDDAGIRRFLRLWFDARPLAEDASSRPVEQATLDLSRARVDQIMAELRASPPLHRLAQSPLLLTMIASLVDEEAIPGVSLANARSNFYNLLINHMLRRDRDIRRRGLAKFQSADKKAALRQLAFAAQSDFGSTPQRSMTQGWVLEQIRVALQAEHRDPSAAQRMLEEIVERSELLVQVDEEDGLYEFPHLTLQEYLAASELAHDPQRLVGLYRTDPVRWREVVKLWCGTARRDCTWVVEETFSGDDEDRLLALECLAEARQVDETLARRIIEHSEDVGLTADGAAHRPLLLVALGAVAASPTPWGRAAFDHLTQTARSAGPTSGGAMQALAATRLPAAMEILKDLAGATAESTAASARHALRAMGEQAIPALRERITTGDESAIDDLGAITTASAGIALAELVTQDDILAARAAWQLARLLTYPDVEEALRNSPAEVHEQTTADWIWEPFRTLDSAGFDRLMDRVATLLWTSDVATIPAQLDVIDPRLAIPICMVGGASVRDKLRPLSADTDRDLSRLWAQLEIVQQSAGDRGPFEIARMLAARRGLPALYDSAIDQTAMPATPRRLLSLLPWRLRLFGLIALLKTEQPTTVLSESSWRRLSSGPPKLGGLAVGTGIAALLLMPIVLTGGIRALLSSLGVWRWGPVWLSWVIAACFLGWALFSFSARRLPRSRVAQVGLATVSRLSLLGTAWLVAATLARLTSWPIAASLVVTTVGLAFGLDYLHRRRLRTARNPLRMMLNLYRRGLSGADSGGSGPGSYGEPPALSLALGSRINR